MKVKGILTMIEGWDSLLTQILVDENASVGGVFPEEMCEFEDAIFYLHSQEAKSFIERLNKQVSVLLCYWAQIVHSLEELHWDVIARVLDSGYLSEKLYLRLEDKYQEAIRI